MSKFIRIPDEMHAALTTIAADEKRGVGLQAQVYIGRGINEYLRSQGEPMKPIFVEDDVHTGVNPNIFAAPAAESQETPPSPKIPAVKTRTIPQILSEISDLDDSKAEALTYCQDAEEGKRISANYDGAIQALWAEYHLLKEA